MKAFNTVGEAVDSYVSGISAKNKSPLYKIFFKAIFSGAMIAFGAEASNVAAHAITNVGLSRLVAGCVFPVGLMMVILLGAELFTGDCMLTIGIPEKVLSVRKCALMLLIIYLGNLIGGVFIALFTYLSCQYNYSNGLLGAYTIKVAVGKVNLPFGSALVSGILCNILVCAAVIMALCATDVTGKILVSFFVILAFVVSGFEHCVANMYYIPAGILCKMNPDYVETAMNVYGISADQLNGLNIVSFTVNNLIPVTIGNILGGSLFFGLPLYFLNRKKKDNQIAEQIEEQKEEQIVEQIAHKVKEVS